MKRSAGIPDLEALVLAEIESLRHSRPARAERPRRARTGAQERPVRRPTPTREVARIAGEDRAADGLSGEEAEGLFEQPFDDDALSDEPAAATPQSLFDAEEQAFMTRAIGFLAGRDNADMILGQIWERLTADRPEAFYRPDEASAAPPPAELNGPDEAPPPAAGADIEPHEE